MDSDDIGLRLVSDLYEKLFIADEWAVRRERGFTWWSYRLAQHVEAEPVTIRGGRPTSTVRIWTEVVNGVDPERDPSTWLAASNMRATLSAVVWDPATRTVTDHSGFLVDEDNGTFARWILSVAAVLQNSEAHSIAHALAEAIGGQPAESHHPSSGVRPVADELLTAPDGMIVSDPRQRSTFPATLDDELATAMAEYGISGCIAEDELVCELPFQGARPLSMLSRGSTVETSLLEVFADVENPDFGAGALMTLALPITFDPVQTAGAANFLNLAEASGSSAYAGTLLGAWCPDPRTENRLAFNTFLPTVLGRPGVLERLIAHEVVRSRFAATELQVPRAELDNEVLTQMFWSVADAIDDGYLPQRSNPPQAVEPDGGPPPLRAAPDLVNRVRAQSASELGIGVCEMAAGSWRGAVDQQPPRL